jgi:acetyl-CoA acetyltransferase
MASTRQSTNVAIIGIGESELGDAGLSSNALHAQAVNRALEDAGIAKGEVDGFVTCDSYTTKRTRHAINVAQYIGFSSERMRYIMTDMHGSTAASGGALTNAILMLNAGICEMVVVASGDNWYAERKHMIKRIAENRDAEFENPYGTFIPGVFGMIAQRYMHDYGATEDDFAEVAVAQRSWANLTSNGQMRGIRISKQDVLASPMIATPHRRLNCALMSDGVAAFVVTSSERAKEWGDCAVTILASEHIFGGGSGIVTDDLGPLESLYNIRDASRIPIARAYKNTGLTIKDMDVVYCYDPFSFMPMLYFEALGLCQDGEGAAFVRDGRIAPGGETPWNTHGGLHSYCHSGVGGGAFHLIEAVRQLRSEAGPRQVNNAELAIYVGEGANYGTFPVTILARGRP